VTLLEVPAKLGGWSSPGRPYIFEIVVGSRRTPRDRPASASPCATACRWTGCATSSSPTSGSSPIATVRSATLSYLERLVATGTTTSTLDRCVLFP